MYVCITFVVNKRIHYITL